MLLGTSARSSSGLNICENRQSENMFLQWLWPWPMLA